MDNSCNVTAGTGIRLNGETEGSYQLLVLLPV